MIVLYQATFWLSLALLAIVITVFVLAVSLLGRAVRISVEEQEKAEQDNLTRNQREILELNVRLNEATENNEKPDIDSLQKSINKIKRHQRYLNWKLRWICIKPKLLRVPLGVILPGTLFVAAIFLSTSAIYYDSSSHETALWLWYSSLATTTIGMIIIVFTLRVTQSVSASTDEASLIRQKEMLKSAMIEVEEEKKPYLEFGFQYEQPPFKIISDQEKQINFYIHMTKGDIARKPRVMFFAPEGFVFPSRTVHKQPNNVGTVGGYLSTTFDLSDCTGAFDSSDSIIIKAPPKKGSYRLWYKVTCERFRGELESFDIQVI